ncbi:hypothetical protein K443DRAFT_132492 [Laccaria amethystina LaAM-08-1]|uniref:60S ribosomal protein L41 n=1 Tax=Laccaria amethystina LaAM-08-1 TaxID=1095629 RepID=A0A0C9WRA2_9AGAR|nr:hypothetical protein K443DRAFT_132492 [Laccaria amethystina LaAM-08-1]
MREKWKKKRSRRLRRKRRKMRARSSACTPHTIAKHANDFLIPCRVNALTSVLAYVTSRSSVQTTLRSDEHGVRSIRHFFTPVLAPGMRLSVHTTIGFWSSVVEVVRWVVQINVLIFSQNQNYSFLPDYLCLSKSLKRLLQDLE